MEQTDPPRGEEQLHSKVCKKVPAYLSTPMNVSKRNLREDRVARECTKSITQDVRGSTCPRRAEEDLWRTRCTGGTDGSQLRSSHAGPDTAVSAFPHVTSSKPENPREVATVTAPSCLQEGK